MTDQQRGATVLPGSRAKMPNVEMLRSQGVTFSHAFCPAPHCCPSRASFFSGLYPTRHGVWNNVAVANAMSRGLDEGIRLFSEDLSDLGYTNEWTGKWHVSDEEGPDSRGWKILSMTAGPREAGSRIADSGWGHYRELDRGVIHDRHATHTEDRAGLCIRPGYPDYVQYGTTENPFGDEDHVESAIRALKTKKPDDGPWCLYIGTLGPHDPYNVPRRFLDWYDDNDIELPASFFDDMRDKPALYRRTRDRFAQLTPAEHRESIRHYLALCSYEDYLFGRVLQVLEDSRQAHNTLVLFVSDHGDYMADHGLWTKGLPCFSGAYHVPAVIRWPDGIANPGRVVDEFVSLTDFAPTFLELAGMDMRCIGSAGEQSTGLLPTSSDVDRSFERRLAGRSLFPFLRNERATDWRDAIFTQSNGNELYGIQRSITTKNWKLVYNGFDYDELYDLEKDPDETMNLLASPDRGAAYRYPGVDAIVKLLYRRLWRFAYENGEQSIDPYITTALAQYGPGLAFTSDEPAGDDGRAGI